VYSSLPDGRVPGQWDIDPGPTRTYYVDQSSPDASDEGDGRADRPFRTIGRAAEVVGPGERVLVAPGVYREQVTPPRGGTGPEAMVSFEAEPGHGVVLRGSHLLPAAWRPAPSAAGTWALELPEDGFSDHNPFAFENLDLSDPTTWQTFAQGNRAASDHHRRGLLFQDGRRLPQFGTHDELVAADGPGYWVTEDGWTLHLRAYDGVDPNSAVMEATNRRQAFAPAGPDVSYLRLKGFVIEQVGNVISYPVLSAVTPMGGHHWVIEDNVVRHVNAEGIGVGSHIWEWGGYSGPRASAPGRDCIVRRNVIADCGVTGMKGISVTGCVIEDNVFDHIGWQNAPLGYDNGAMKLLVCTDTLVRHNVIRNSLDAPGIWLDWDNVNCRVSENAVFGTRYAGGAIFIEASEQPNWVDHNVIWDSQGNGVYLQDADGVVVFDNIIGRSTAAAIDGRVCTDRELNGRQVTCRKNEVRSNLLIDNAIGISFTDPDNICENNTVVGNAAPEQGVEGQDDYGRLVRAVLAGRDGAAP
jgi:hypothetical protein